MSYRKDQAISIRAQSIGLGLEITYPTEQAIPVIRKILDCIEQSEETRPGVFTVEMRHNGIFLDFFAQEDLDNLASPEQKERVKDLQATVPLNEAQANKL